MGTSSNLLHQDPNSAQKSSGENSELDLYTIPIGSSWFKWEDIHEKEKEVLKEFFEGTSLTRTPKIYKEYRDFIINKFREDSSKRLTFSQVRKHLVGDISLLLKVFHFLEGNGLINFNLSSPQIEREEKDDDVRVECSTSNGIKITGIDGPSISRPNPIPSTRKPLPSPLASYSDSFHSSLSGEEDNAEKKDAWSEEETLLLLESVLQHGDDWDQVLKDVPNKSKADCISKLLDMPFGDLIVPPKEHSFPSPMETLKIDEVDGGPPLKKHCSGFDSSLMEQVISMSSTVGHDVTSAAATAAIDSICDEISCPRDALEKEEIIGYQKRLCDAKEAEEDPILDEEEDAVPLGLRLRSAAATSLGAAAARARILGAKEMCEMEKMMEAVLETQVKKLQVKLKQFEELEGLMEREYEELDALKKCLIEQRMLVLQNSVRSGASKI